MIRVTSCINIRIYIWILKTKIHLFSRIFHLLELGYESFNVERDGYKKIQHFPKVIPKETLGEIYTEQRIILEQHMISELQRGHSVTMKYHVIGDKLSFLKPSDIIIVESVDKKLSSHVKITAKYFVTTKEYIVSSQLYDIANTIEKHIGYTPLENDILTVFEFRVTYPWEFEKSGSD